MPPFLTHRTFEICGVCFWIPKEKIGTVSVTGYKENNQKLTQLDSKHSLQDFSQQQQRLALFGIYNNLGAHFSL